MPKKPRPEKKRASRYSRADILGALASLAGHAGNATKAAESTGVSARTITQWSVKYSGDYDRLKAELETNLLPIINRVQRKALQRLEDVIERSSSVFELCKAIEAMSALKVTLRGGENEGQQAIADESAAAGVRDDVAAIVGVEG